MSTLIPVLFALLAQAQPSGVCQGGSCLNVQIKHLYTGPGYHAVSTNADEAGLFCSSNGEWLVIPSASDQQDRMFAAILSAYLSQKTVDIRLNDSGSACTIQYVVLK